MKYKKKSDPKTQAHSDVMKTWKKTQTVYTRNEKQMNEKKNTQQQHHSRREEYVHIQVFKYLTKTPWI